MKFEVPDKNLFYVADRGDVPSIKDVADALHQGFMNPIGAPPLRDSVREGDKVVILADDLTRPTPQKTLLPLVVDELNALGVRDDDIEVIIALGTHRPMSDEEIIDRFGKAVVEKVQVTNHDYKHEEGLVDLGRTPLGIPIVVNRKIVEADYVISIGNIVPHCYSGWAGGGKMVQPGVSGYETTAETHVMAGKIRPLSRITGNLDNPIRKEMDEIAVKAGLRLIVNTILNADDEISKIMVGDPVKALHEGVKFAEKIYCPEVPGLADIVVLSSYPADIDYWQAHKATVYGTLGVKEGGTVILVTPCPEGISRQHPEVAEWGSRSYEDILRATDNGEIKDRIAAGILLIHAQAVGHAEVVCVSEYLKESEKKSIGFRHAESVEEAIQYALKKHGENAKIGILRCGEIVPKVRESL